MAPLTAQSQRTMSRASMRSSGSTLRPPSAAGTELDWDSLSVSGQGSQARQSPRGSARILSVDTIPEGAEGEFEGEGDYAPLEGLDVMTESQRESVESLPPISKAVSDGGGSQYEDMGAITAEQRSDLNEQYLENHVRHRARCSRPSHPPRARCRACWNPLVTCTAVSLPRRNRTRTGSRRTAPPARPKKIDVRPCAPRARVARACQIHWRRPSLAPLACARRLRRVRDGKLLILALQALRASLYDFTTLPSRLVSGGKGTLMTTARPA